MNVVKTPKVDYVVCDGVFQKNIKVDSLEEAKEIALEEMNYTGNSVIIKDEHGGEITRSIWFGVVPSESELENGLVLEQFGDFGYYQIWVDELENMAITAIDS